ncbi:hypothetical protein ACFE04_031841 [Oxalis oulophora]
MDNHEEQLTTSTTSAVKRRSLKRKLEQDFEQQQREDRKPFAIDSSDVASQDLEQEIRVHVDILNSKLTSSESDRALAKAAAHQIAEIAKNDDWVELIVECDAVPALVKHLRAPSQLTEGDVNYEHEVEKVCAFAIGLLAVKRAAAGSLRTLAFKKDENKNLIVECNALPTLVLMLQSLDTAICYEAVGVIGNLVHSSPAIKKEVLQAGALQPVIRLLSSSCSESQREAALLLGQFAAADSDCKIHIVQRGAVSPLVKMLQSPDAQLKEMSAFALGRLSQDVHNQAGIAQSDAVLSLLKLLDSKNGSLQHNAAFTLYGLADNEDNVADLIKVGGVQKLQDGEFIFQPTKDCAAKTLKRLEEKIHGPCLNYLLYLMRMADKVIQRRVILALAHLCAPGDQKNVFINNNGLELLLELLDSTNMKQKKDGSMALYKLATKSTFLHTVDAAPASPSPQVYLGEQYVNNPTLSDVTFLVDGKRFYAHRICLLASSDAFRAMFDGGYREKDAKDVEIPNIRWDIFELMMRFIYTGSVDVNVDIAQDLLRAADQYLLEGLKRICEHAIAKDIAVENVTLLYDLSEAFNALTLRHACILFILEQYDKLCTKPWYPHLIRRILPDIRNYFVNVLTQPLQANLGQI